MPVIVKNVLATINSSLLYEELIALPTSGTSWAGFDRTPGDRRRYQVAAARRIVARSVVNGVTVEDFADPGDIRFDLTRDLTGPEDAALDAALAAHDSALLTLEQVREDQDEVDLDSIIATERDDALSAVQRLAAVVAAWDAADNSQRQAFMKASISDIHDVLQTFAKLLRFVVRKERGTAI